MNKKYIKYARVSVCIVSWLVILVQRSTVDINIFIQHFACTKSIKEYRVLNDTCIQSTAFRGNEWQDTCSFQVIVFLCARTCLHF